VKPTGVGLCQDVPPVTGRAISGLARVARLNAPPPRRPTMGRAHLAALLLFMASGGCTPKQEGEAGKRPRSERERDSVLGASQLPGARGVRGALGASDSAAARNARLDSVANQP
jgi:hypothetical protein